MAIDFQTIRSLGRYTIVTPAYDKVEVDVNPYFKVVFIRKTTNYGIVYGSQVLVLNNPVALHHSKYISECVDYVRDFFNNLNNSKEFTTIVSKEPQ